MSKVASKSLIDIQKQFGTDEQCLAYLEAMRWPDGVRCVKCDSDKISKFTTKEGSRKRRNRKTGEFDIVPVPARHLYECLNPECRHQFSATANTIFNDTHLPLSTWFMAVALMINAKKGLSAKQLERDLNINYRTAWYLAHRIRKAMEDGAPGLLSGTLECDETYYGPRRYDQRVKNAIPGKARATIWGVVQRSTPETPSRVRAFPIKTASRRVVTSALVNNVSMQADLVVTDESKIYNKIGGLYPHQTVNHIRLEYVRATDPNVHTNTIENFWSLFKRGVIGSYHKVSLKHLQRYLDEFTFRFSNRQYEDLFGFVVLNLLITSGIKYAELIADQPETSDDVPF